MVAAFVADIESASVDVWFDALADELADELADALADAFVDAFAGVVVAASALALPSMDLDLDTFPLVGPCEWPLHTVVLSVMDSW